jgi:glycosyltransferase involved in cell wall biosynthesis
MHNQRSEGLSAQDESPLVSIIIPTVNSASFIEEVIVELHATSSLWPFPVEIIVVDDGSQDETWRELCRLNARFKCVKPYRMLTNQGQHTAQLAGLSRFSGDYVVFMDDDGQHPPDEVPSLVSTLQDGRDLVFALPTARSASLGRRVGSQFVVRIVRLLFPHGDKVKVASLKACSRQIGNRVVKYAQPHPYMNGELLLCAGRPANIHAKYRPSVRGQSNYSFLGIMALTLTIVFSYSIAPVRIAVWSGLLLGTLSFLGSSALLVNALLGRQGVPGWTSTVLILSLLLGALLFSIAAVSETLGKILIQTRRRPRFLFESEDE